VTYGDIIGAVWNSSLNFLGELGSSEARIWFVSGLYDEKLQRGVIRCRHDCVEKVRAVLSLVQMIGESRSILKIVGVTGTIKAAKNKYLVGTLKEYAGE
jgi:ribonuclease P/MRP protein subunit POP5